MVVGQSTGATCLEPEVLSGSPEKVGSKAPVKLPQEEYVLCSKPGRSATHNLAPEKTLYRGTDFPINVDEYGSEGDGLSPIQTKGATVPKKNIYSGSSSKGS